MGLPTTAFGNRSVSDMVTLVYGLVRHKPSDPVTGISSANIIDYISKWDCYFWEYAKWTFRKTSQVLPVSQNTTLAADFNTTDLTFSVADGSGATAGGGRVLINGEEIDYDSASGTTVTVTVNAAKKKPHVKHYKGDTVNWLVAAPSDLDKPGEAWLGNNSNPAWSKMYHLDTRQLSYMRWPYYTFRDSYFILPINTTATRVQFEYYKKAFQAGQNDSLQTPQQYDNFVKWCAAAECYQVLGDQERAEDFFSQAGVPTPHNLDPVGILQMAAARNQEQTDSLDEVFVPSY